MYIHCYLRQKILKLFKKDANKSRQQHVHVIVEYFIDQKVFLVISA